MLTGKQRARLRSEANTMTPAFQIGKGGIEPTVTKAVDDCLQARELVKVKLLETSPIDAREAADILAEQVNADVIQVIGRTFVLFKQKKKNSVYKEVFKK